MGIGEQRCPRGCGTARRFVTPVIGEVPVRTLTRAHMQAIVDQAGTKSVGEQLFRCVSAMVGCGLE